MEKCVVRFKRETTVKDDICYGEGEKLNLITQEDHCKNCRVHMVTDRFLSEKFQQDVMKDFRKFPNGIYPYVLILDTAYCNIRCRACYSWIYWGPNKEADATTVDERTLAKQFRCKIEKLHEKNLIAQKSRVAEKSKRPFSRLRISGGEPSFNMEAGSPSQSFDFWLGFFKHLDNEIGDLLSEGKLTLKSEAEWINMSAEERRALFPVFLKSDNGKVRIRFDTNGVLFKNKEYAEKFINGIYGAKLSNIKIDITFSIKGTNRAEVNWFVNPKSKFDATKINSDEALEDHPQWDAIVHIIESISCNESSEILDRKTRNLISETYFNPCGDVSLTLERGIMHNPDEKLYLYSKEALNWSAFEEKLKSKGLMLSKTQNAIYIGKYPGAVAWRYINSGNYEIQLKCPNYSDKAFVSYSKAGSSFTGSLEHRKISYYTDPNLDHLVKKMQLQSKQVGKPCSTSDHKCDYWIELVPLKAESK